jgi:hypothetical protein
MLDISASSPLIAETKGFAALCSTYLGEFFVQFQESKSFCVDVMLYNIDG